MSKKKEPKYAGSVCFDYWPPSDWTRLNIKRWNPGKYFQVNIGPIRIEWFAN